MYSKSAWLLSLWKLLLLLVLLEVGYTCPNQCTCSRLPSNKLLSNLFLGNTSLTSNGTEELESVVCNKKSLTQLPDIPTEVVHLDLTQNELITLDEELCKLSQLKTLILTDNKITKLDYGVFGNLSLLQHLIIKDNRIAVIQTGAFQHLTHLRNLDLASNRIPILSSDVFSGLHSLKTLNISYNQITRVKKQALKALKYIEVLDLSFNSIQRFHLNTFGGLTQLRILNLSHNALSYISTQTFKSLERLEVLNLSHNNIQSTSDFLFKGLNALITLDLSNNILTFISEMTFNNMSNLKNLYLDSNSLSEIDIPIFKTLHNLSNLSITQMPYLVDLSYDTFTGLDNLVKLNLSLNPLLSFINPHLFSTMPQLQIIDLHSNSISYLSALTFHRNTNLTDINLTNNTLQCKCDIAWLVKYDNNNLTCAIKDGGLIPLSHVTNESFPCANITQNLSEPSTFYFKIGSAFRLTCNVTLDPTMIVIWTTPRKKTLTYHAFHPDATKHHPNPDYINKEPDWINSTSYHSEMIYRQSRIILLSDASLYVDYVLRNDAGPYVCEVTNAHHKVSTRVYICLDFQILYDIVNWSLIIGFCCAASFFVLILVYTVIRQCTIRVINKRRRDAIRQLLENIDVYKHNQVTKIRDHYSTQIGRVSEHYHTQLERLRNNYTMQMGRVKRGCSDKVDKVRDNYSTQVGRLKDYSSHQIDQLRAGYNNQLLKLRDFGSLQFDRLRETCKQQQMNVMKLMETMNIENCKGIIETECMRTDSMIFEPEFAHDDDIQELSLIGSESDYITASDTDDSKSNNSQLLEVDIGIQTETVQLEREDIFEPLIFAENDVAQSTNRDDTPVTIELDLGDISLETVI